MDILAKTNTALRELKMNGYTKNVTEDDAFSPGAKIRIRGNDLVNFGSCSYLGLELDQRIKNEMKDMIDRYGSLLSSSRVYLGLKAYREAEELLARVFDKDVIISSTCTLGHISNIPILVNKKDLVILDQQVHNSVVQATTLASAKGFKTIRVKHNRIDLLEGLIEENRDKYEKIWYMADGVYSMYGDVVPVKDVFGLLDKYPNFHFYVDDAHGMGWAGEKGRGYVLSKVGYHPRMTLVSSFAKGLAAAGGVTLVSDPLRKEYIENCGSTHIFSGPISPSMLGALNASLKILLSDELPKLQESLQKRMTFFVQKAGEYNIPLFGKTDLTPVFYIGIGNPRISRQIYKALEKEGYYVNIAVYPAVSEFRSGIRLPITNNNSIEQIDGFMTVLAENLFPLLKKENTNIEEVKSLFEIK